MIGHAVADPSSRSSHAVVERPFAVFIAFQQILPLVLIRKQIQEIVRGAVSMWIPRSYLVVKQWGRFAFERRKSFRPVRSLCSVRAFDTHRNDPVGR